MSLIVIAGRIQVAVSGSNGDVFLSDSAGGNCSGNRNLGSLQRERADGSDRGREHELGIGRDIDIHGAGGPSCRGFYEPKDANQRGAPSRSPYLSSSGCCLHVCIGHMGLIIPLFLLY